MFSAIKQNKRPVAIICGVIILLLIPLTVMQFSDEVKWTLSDFVAATILLFVAGLILEFIFRKVKTAKCRIIAGVVLFLILLLAWMELAVGILGTPFAGS